MSEKETTVGPDAPKQPKTRKKRKSSNYSLQKFCVMYSEPTKAEQVWVGIKEGFVSPKAAWAYAASSKLEGVMRVVRVVTDTFAHTLTVPEPVLTVEKVEIGG